MKINEQVHKGVPAHVCNRIGKRFRDRVWWQIYEHTREQVDEGVNVQAYWPIQGNLTHEGDKTNA